MLKILIVETDREAEQLALYKMRLLVSALELELISQRVGNFWLHCMLPAGLCFS